MTAAKRFVLFGVCLVFKIMISFALFLAPNVVLLIAISKFLTFAIYWFFISALVVLARKKKVSRQVAEQGNNNFVDNDNTPVSVGANFKELLNVFNDMRRKKRTAVPYIKRSINQLNILSEKGSALNHLFQINGIDSATILKAYEDSENNILTCFKNIANVFVIWSDTAFESSEGKAYNKHIAYLEELFSANEKTLNLMDDFLLAVTQWINDKQNYSGIDEHIGLKSTMSALCEVTGESAGLKLVV